MYLLHWQGIRFLMQLAVVLRLINQECVRISSINPDARVYVIGVLPRPIDNKHSKLKIININRLLAKAVQTVANNNQEVKYITVSWFFLNKGQSLMQYFTDSVNLNQQGLHVFHKAVFQEAGFVQNE